MHKTEKKRDKKTKTQKKSRKNLTRRKKGGIFGMKSWGVFKPKGITEQEWRVEKERRQIARQKAYDEDKKIEEFMNNPEKMTKFEENANKLYVNGQIPNFISKLHPNDSAKQQKETDGICNYLADRYGKGFKTEVELVKLRCKKGWSSEKFYKIMDFAKKNRFFEPEVFDSLLPNEKKLMCKVLLDDLGLIYSTIPQHRIRLENECLVSEKPLLKSARV